MDTSLPTCVGTNEVIPTTPCKRQAMRCDDASSRGMGTEQRSARRQRHAVSFATICSPNGDDDDSSAKRWEEQSLPSESCQDAAEEISSWICLFDDSGPEKRAPAASTTTCTQNDDDNNNDDDEGSMEFPAELLPQRSSPLRVCDFHTGVRDLQWDHHLVEESDDEDEEEYNLSTSAEHPCWQPQRQTA